MFHQFFRRPFTTRLHRFIRYTTTSHRTFTFTTRRLFEWYSDVLDRRPYTTQMATSGFLGGIADVTTQYLEHGWDEQDGRTPKDWDFRRLCAVTSFGIFAMGPVGHIWYLQLDKFCVRFCKSKTSMIVTKVMGDTFLFGPAALWSFFASVSYMEGMPWNEISHKLHREFVPTYIIDYSMWPIVQGINFRYIPVRHQLMFVNTACYFDDIFLSYVEHNGLDRMPILRDIQAWWDRYLDGPPQTNELNDNTKALDQRHLHSKSQNDDDMNPLSDNRTSPKTQQHLAIEAIPR